MERTIRISIWNIVFATWVLSPWVDQRWITLGAELRGL